MKRSKSGGVINLNFAVRNFALTGGLFLAILPPAHADLATVAAVASGVNSIAQAFRPRSDYTVEILLAMSSNIAAINSGLQVALKNIQEIKELQHRLPSEIYENNVFRGAALNFKALIELTHPSYRLDPAFNEWAYYRDIFQIYKSAREARQIVLSHDFKMSENAAFHLPIIFMTEAQSYYLLALARTGLPEEKYKDFLVNEGSWKAALHSYLAFYENALNEKKEGTLAAERIRAATDSFAMVDKGKPEWSDFEHQNFIICYSKLISYRKFGDVELDESGPTTIAEYDVYEYDFLVRDYYFKFDYPSRELEDFAIDDKTVESRATLSERSDKSPWVAQHVANYFNQDECYRRTNYERLPQDDPFNGIDFSSLRKNLNRRAMLGEVRKMNKTVAKSLFEQTLIFSPDERKAYPILTKEYGK